MAKEFDGPIAVGRTYRAKRPRTNGWGRNNDRTVIWIDALGHQLQYDSDTVRDGHHYPKTTVEAFRRWAAADVTPAPTA